MNGKSTGDNKVLESYAEDEVNITEKVEGSTGIVARATPQKGKPAERAYPIYDDDFGYRGLGYGSHRGKCATRTNRSDNRNRQKRKGPD